MTPHAQSLEREPSKCQSDFAEDENEERSSPACWKYYHLAKRKPAKVSESPRRQEAMSILDLKLQLITLSKQVQELTRRIRDLEDLPEPLVVPINTFAPRPFEPVGQILVVVEPVLDESGEPCEYIATFADGSVSVTGDTIEEALLLLKSRMVSQYNLLTKKPPEQLGKIPQQQLASLKAVMRRVQ